MIWNSNQNWDHWVLELRWPSRGSTNQTQVTQVSMSITLERYNDRIPIQLYTYIIEHDV